MASAVRLPYKNEYTGRVQHPVGVDSDNLVELHTASKGYITATCRVSQRVQKIAITVTRDGNTITLAEVDEDDEGNITVLEGQLQEDGSIIGDVIQIGERGGYFKIHPTASACDVDEESETVMKRLLSVAKAVAGTIRFLSEDVYNGACQLIYLCKIWNKEGSDWGTRLFVLSSVAAGVLCSLAGPIQEALTLCRLPESSSKIASRRYGALASGVSSPLSSADGASVSAQSSPQKHANLSAKRPPADLDQFLFDDPPTTNPRWRRSWRAHKLLLFAACCYWASMGCIFWLVEPECGGAIPKTAWLIFLTMTMLCTLIEVWLLIQTRNGHLLFKYCGAPVIMGVALENLGRYDTFADVTNAVIIGACSQADPEFFSWFSIYGHRFPLPAPLGQMMEWGLLSILVAQALPGIILLATKQFTAVALKLNEFCILLNAIGREAYRDEQDPDDFGLAPAH